MRSYPSVTIRLGSTCLRSISHASSMKLIWVSRQTGPARCRASSALLVMGRPAIHIDRLAGDKVTVLRGQKHHRPRQVRGLFTPLDDLLAYDPGPEAGHRLRGRNALRRLR